MSDRNARLRHRRTVPRSFSCAMQQSASSPCCYTAIRPSSALSSPPERIHRPEMIINRADSLVAYDRFLRRIIEFKFVWLLVHEEEDLPAACASNDLPDRHVVPVWSDRAYAVKAQPLFMYDTRVERIPLKNFIERTVLFLADRGELIGPNWNSGLAGLEVDPLEILRKLQPTEGLMASTSAPLRSIFFLRRGSNHRSAPPSAAVDTAISPSSKPNLASQTSKLCLSSVSAFASRMLQGPRGGFFCS